MNDDDACPLMARYASMVSAGHVTADPAQAEAVRVLSALRARLRAHHASLASFFAALDEYNDERDRLTSELEWREREAHEARRRRESGKEAGEGTCTTAENERRGGESSEEAAARMAREALEHLGPPPAPPRAPRGVYLWGGVGAGKSMLMDLFFESTADVMRHRRRVHFHAAMLELHARMHQLQRADDAAEAEARAKAEGQPVEGAAGGEETGFFRGPLAVARGILLAVRRRRRRRNVAAQMPAGTNSSDGGEGGARDGKWQMKNSRVLRLAAREMLGDSEARDGGFALLCFDEFQVTDAFAAVALKGVFEELLRAGAVVVATSNRSIAGLNSDGMQKELFDAFADTLRSRVEEVEVRADADYRRLAHDRLKAAVEGRSGASGGDETETGPRVYFYPLDDTNATSAFEACFARFLDKGSGKSSATKPTTASTSVPVMFGRSLRVPRASPCGRAARFTFAELCKRPLGAADFIALAQGFDVVFVSDVPRMSLAVRDQARRFITLVDEAYNHGCVLVCSADAPPDQLFDGGDWDEHASRGGASMLDLESLQFEGEAEGARLRRDVTAAGGVAPVAGTASGMRGAVAQLSGLEERFAFKRAVSRLLEMQTPAYVRERM